MIFKDETTILEYIEKNQAKRISIETFYHEALEAIGVDYERAIANGELYVEYELIQDVYIDTIFVKMYSYESPEINGTIGQVMR